MAKLIEISPPYLSDVEKDRRNPFDMNKLEKVSNILHLTKDERTIMFESAGKKRNYIAPDLIEYIKRDYVSSTLRVARDLDATKEDFVRFADEIIDMLGS